MNNIVTDNYVGRYLSSYKTPTCRGGFGYTSLLKLPAVKIHVPKNFNVMYEMTHRALEHLGVLGSGDTWGFEFEPEYTGLVVYDKKGEKTQWVKVDLKQEVLLLYTDRCGSMVRTSELPRYNKHAVDFNILELTPTEEVEVKEPPVKQYNVVLKSGSTLIMNLTDEMYKSFTGVGILADAKQLIVLDASEVESIKEVKPEVKEPVEPATTYTETTPVKSDLSFDGLDRDYVGEDESVPKKKHSEYYSNDDWIEAIYIIEYCHLHFSLGNVLKYLMRAGKKTPSKVSDYQKASWYLNYLLNSRDLLREQFDALEPYFDRSGAIIKLVEDVPLNNTLCEILSIYRFYSSFSEFEYALKKMHHGLNLAITAEVERNLE